MTDFDVLCVGSAALDTICVVEEHPTADSRVLTDSFTTSGGGPAGTAAVAMARLGVRVAFCGILGDDEDADRVIDGLEAEGVDTRFVIRRADAHTPRSVIVAARSTGTRAIVTTSALTPLANDIPRDAAPIIHVDQSGFGSAAAIAATGAVRLSVDGGNPVPGLDLRHVWLYAPSVPALLDEFPAADAYTAARHAREAGARVVVATGGETGSFWLGDNGLVNVPGFSIDVASTLGAGDVFHGALVAALVRGLTDREALVWANAAAALSCTAIDGRSAIPTAVELEEFLRANQPEESRS